MSATRVLRGETMQSWSIDGADREAGSLATSCNPATGGLLLVVELRIMALIPNGKSRYGVAPYQYFIAI